MRSGHGLERQRLAVFAESGAVTGIVAETVLDTDNDPVASVRTC